MTFLLHFRTHRTRFVKTVCLYAAFLCLGLNGGLIGPTIMDLQLAVNVTTEDVAFLLPGRAGGYALGSLLVGLLYTRLNPLITNFSCLSLAAVTLAFAPWNRKLIGLIATMAINGFASGMIDSTNNMFILELWGKDSQPFMQTLHFFFGLGNLIAPLLATPFLLPFQVECSTSNLSTLCPVTETRSPSDLKIQYAYLIISIITLIASVLSLMTACAFRDNPPHPSLVQPQTVQDKPRTLDTRVQLVIIVLTCFLAHVVMGMTLSVGSLLTVFAVKSDLKLLKVTGSYITSAYWSTFTFFRVAAAIYIDFIGPTKNIVFELFLVMASNVFLVPFGSREPWCLWLGTALLGLGLSSIWGSIYGYLNQFFAVNSSTASALTVSACLGEFVFPFVMGQLVERHPDSFLYITFICSITCCVLFVSIHYLSVIKLQIKT